MNLGGWGVWGLFCMLGLGKLLLASNSEVWGGAGSAGRCVRSPQCVPSLGLPPCQPLRKSDWILQRDPGSGGCYQPRQWEGGVRHGPAGGVFEREVSLQSRLCWGGRGSSVCAGPGRGISSPCGRHETCQDSGQVPWVFKLGGQDLGFLEAP